MRKNSFKNLSCGRNLAPKKTWKFLRLKETQEKFHKVDYSNIFILIFAYFITHFCVHLINIRFFNGGEMGFGCLLKLCEELTGNSSHSCKFWWVISLYTVIKTTMLQRTLPTVSLRFQVIQIMKLMISSCAICCDMETILIYLYGKSYVASREFMLWFLFSRFHILFFAIFLCFGVDIQSEILEQTF